MLRQRTYGVCLAVAAVSMAEAAPAFPFERVEASLDFNQSGAGPAFRSLVERTARAGLVYVDWSFRNPNKSHVLAPGLEDEARDGGCAGVLLDRTQAIEYSGSPDPSYHHSVVSIVIPPANDHLFTDVRCEEYSSTEAVFTIRGFFRVYSTRIATAFEHEMRSVDVEPALIRSRFFGG